MTGFRIDLTGDETALSVLADTIARTDNSKSLFDAIGAALAVSTQHRFETESDPDGNPWPASLRKLVEGGRTLTATARLVQSITHQASDSGVAVGTNVIYAAIHQAGGTIRAKTSVGLADLAGGRPLSQRHARHSRSDRAAPGRVVIRAIGLAAVLASAPPRLPSR